VSGPFWTAADAAELDVLVLAFIEGYYEHRFRCAVCAARGPWCEHAAEAFQALLDWRRRRELLSRAEALRLERLTGLGEAV
jgi:hypothetical protein